MGKDPGAVQAEFLKGCPHFGKRPNQRAVPQIGQLSTGEGLDLRRNPIERTLILIGQIQDNREHGLSPFDALVEATVQRSRPVVLTALAAVLAFVPLTTSVFWGAMAFTLIGGTLGGTILTLVFLPALYALWHRIRADEPGPSAASLAPSAPGPHPPALRPATA